MKPARYIVLRLLGGLISMAAALALGITAFVYTGQEHRETVTLIARDFFVLVERASRVRRAPVGSLASPTPEGGVIQ